MKVDGLKQMMKGKAIFKLAIQLSPYIHPSHEDSLPLFVLRFADMDSLILMFLQKYQLHNRRVSGSRVVSQPIVQVTFAE